MISTWRILVGDVRERLAELPDASVQCCVTSPPYFGLRDYGVAGQIGLEPTPEAFVEAMVSVFRAVRRVLKNDGVLWLNLGDSYNSGSQFNHHSSGLGDHVRYSEGGRGTWPGHRPNVAGLKNKDLIGIPWRVALALQADGWYLRSDIIWHKPNPMPESITDRPTKSHEYIFLLSKSSRYYYDADAIKEPATNEAGGGSTTRADMADAGDGRFRVYAGLRGGVAYERRNARTVWTITTQPYPEAHFATFPEALPERCIKAGSRIGDTVLDPFTGSGTTGAVAVGASRNFVGIELNPEYVQLARRRIGKTSPLFAEEVPA